MIFREAVGHFAKYWHVSDLTIKAPLNAFSPKVFLPKRHIFSIDEAWMTISSVHLMDSLDVHQAVVSCFSTVEVGMQ